MIRVLIADDSAFMRKVLSDLFNNEADFEVVGTAVNGKETIAKVKELKPDLLTLDVNMPVMDGLDALAIIMEENPLPVVMISSMTQRGATATIRSLELGAVDFIGKSGGASSRIDEIRPEILEKCRIAAKVSVRRLGALRAGSRPSSVTSQILPPTMRRVEFPKRSTSVSGTPPATNIAKPEPVFGRTRQNPLLQPRAKPFQPRPVPSSSVSQSGFAGGSRKLVAIGTSTGGPQALQKVITQLPGNLPCGVVIVQHMPPGFTKSLAERLDTISDISVKEAEHNEIIRPGQVYIAPGNYHMRVTLEGAVRKIALSQEPPVGNHRPAVNVLFDSVAPLQKELVSVIMTGMGCDGCEGMKKIKQQGGYIIAQDEETSVVYGMPKAVVDAGLADEVRPLQAIADAIVAAVKR